MPARRCPHQWAEEGMRSQRIKLLLCTVAAPATVCSEFVRLDDHWKSFRFLGRLRTNDDLLARRPADVVSRECLHRAGCTDAEKRFNLRFFGFVAAILTAVIA